MCWVCSPMMKNALATDYWANHLGIEAAHFEALQAAAASDDQPTPLESGPTDTVPDAITTDNPELVTGADPVISAIDAPGDQDFFRVEFEAGQAYEISQHGYAGGPLGAPLPDAYLEIYDAEGNLLQSADGGARTPSGETYGLDAMLTFYAEEAGVYYINARSFDQAPEDGTDGDGVGSYEIFVRETSYVPYYDLDSPLHSLDWTTEVDGTSRNPDGQEGPRPTGNAQQDSPNEFDIAGKNVITYYFAEQGDIFITEDPTSPGLTDTIVASGMADWEKQAFRDGFDEFEEVADVVYIEVSNRDEADFKLITYNGTPEAGVLGRMSPPNTQNEGQAEFNRNGPGWTEAELQRGGFMFNTVIHELGHGHGMSHPHDTGGRSSVMRGVESDGGAFSYTLGYANLNQGIYTMMSYMDGWQTSPYGNSPDDAYGYVGSLMAFDIAVIQDKYGVNEETRTGDDTYRMKDVNASGTYYESIWDAAGHDQIVYTGNRNTRIDLRDATLEYEHGGGGFLSYANGIYGGYTIANSVTIEDARSDAGNDKLVGNEAVNRLISGSGNDLLQGYGGSDSLYGQDGRDSLFGGGQKDFLFGGADGDTLSGHHGDDVIYGGFGFDIIRGGFHRDTIRADEGDDWINGNLGDDAIFAGAGVDRILGGSGADTFFFLEGDTGSNILFADRIRDHARGDGDRINLAAIDANVADGTDDEAFTFIGKAAFSGTAGELRYIAGQDGNAYVQADTNGDKTADLVLIVERQTELIAADFVL